MWLWKYISTTLELGEVSNNPLSLLVKGYICDWIRVMMEM